MKNKSVLNVSIPIESNAALLGSVFNEILATFHSRMESVSVAKMSLDMTEVLKLSEQHTLELIGTVMRYAEME